MSSSHNLSFSCLILVAYSNTLSNIRTYISRIFNDTLNAANTSTMTTRTKIGMNSNENDNKENAAKISILFLNILLQSDE